MKKLSNILALSLLSSSYLLASNTGMLNGKTGIIETPNARIMPDWSMRMYINQDQPYTYYGFSATPLPFFEADLRITQLDGIDGFSSNDGYGDYKDKALSFKLLLQEEGSFLPSVVFGADDFWGTGLYTSKYIAMGKKIGYFDFTLGYAKGRLAGNQITSTASANSGSTDNRAFNFMKELDWSGGKPFGSVVFNAHPKFDLLAEYSPIDYKKDSQNPFGTNSSYEDPKSNINLGIKYYYSPNSTFNLAYTRGNNIAFGYNYQFAFDRTGLFDHLPDPKWKASKEALKEYENLDEKQLSEKLANEVAAEKMKKVTTSVYNNKIWTEFENSRYNSDIKAAGRVISTIDEVAPSNYDTIYVTLKEKDIPSKTFKVNRAEYDAFENEKVSSEYMKNALILTNSVEKMYKEFSENQEEIYKSKKYNNKKFKYEFNIKADSVLNSQEDPFALKLSGRLNLGYDFGNGFFSTATITHPFYNEIKNLPDKRLEQDEKLSIGSSLLEYQKYDSTQLRNLSLTYMFKTPYESFSKLEVGYFGTAFAGLDAQWYKSFYDDRFGIGLQYQNVYKRVVDDMFKIKNDINYTGKFLNIYSLLSTEYDLHLGLKIGEFMAGDRGVRVDIARHHKEFSLGAFATFTNSDEVFTNSQNKGYIDKGIFIRVPLEVLTYENLKSLLAFGISPWTRDVGAFASPSVNLYPLNNNENNSQIMRKNINKFKE